MVRNAVILGIGFTILSQGMAHAQTGDQFAGITKRLQDEWMTCLKSSFKVTSTQTADRNAAAEMSFHACASEENALSSYSAGLGAPRSMFAYLKSQTKQVLMAGQ
jgi:hypothetical protein